MPVFVRVCGDRMDGCTMTDHTSDEFVTLCAFISC